MEFSSMGFAMAVAVIVVKAAEGTGQEQQCRK
jgi:hypothetical protein